ncbi:MAG: zinc ribbon domain-containing protein [Chlorobiaceae bacterium]|nr:zinc ribbon domain-containing protein [Chlorobiaceae bacterium]
MPTYHYRCSSCGCETEVFQRMTDDALTTCTGCGKETFERVISAEGGFVLKGSGFYGTDYCGSKSSAKGSESGGGCSTGSCPFAK